MANILFDEIKAEWTAVSGLETLTSGKTYEIQNRNGDDLLVNISSSKPTDQSGTLVKSGETYVTIYNSDEIYLRALNTSCFVNINEKEEVAAEGE